MSKKDKLTLEQEKELIKLSAEIEAEAIKMKMDYEENPSHESGSVVHIHQESSLLKNEDEKYHLAASIQKTIKEILYEVSCALKIQIRQPKNFTFDKTDYSKSIKVELISKKWWNF